MTKYDSAWVRAEEEKRAKLAELDPPPAPGEPEGVKREADALASA